jgi:hypothetical protein
MGTADRFDPHSLRQDLRLLGPATLVSGIIVLLMVTDLLPLPRGPRILIGFFAGLTLVIAGAQFLFCIATFVSVTLDGHHRRRFQLALSLVVPIAFAFILSGGVDALPAETLSGMMTPALLFPVGIFAWIGWYGGSQLDRDHPFRGFVFAAAALFVLCWLLSMGLTSWSDDETSHSYLDPELAKRARETGEYVFRFVLYVSTVYLAMFLRWRKEQPDQP